MNIFYLDKDPVICAQYHNDSHCRKMIVESAQLLCTAHRVLDGRQGVRLSKNNRNLKSYMMNDLILENSLYKATHQNHPSAKWCVSLCLAL